MNSSIPIKHGMGFIFVRLLETTWFQFKSKLLLPKIGQSIHTFKKRETNFSNGCECNKYLWSWCGNHINYPLFSSRLFCRFSTLLSFSIFTANSIASSTLLFSYWAHFIHNCLLLLLVFLNVWCVFFTVLCYFCLQFHYIDSFVCVIQCNDIRL